MLAIPSITNGYDLERSVRIRYEYSDALEEQGFIRENDIYHEVISIRPDIRLYTDDGYWEFRAVPNIYYDVAYEKMDIYDEQDVGEYSTDIDLRDTYIGYRGSNSVIRVGRQVISWGKMDGLRLADRVNPVNLERYMVPYLYDYEEGVQHVSAVSWDVFTSHSNFQFVVVPEYQQSKLPSVNNRFSPYYPYRSYEVDDSEEPASSRPEYGFRYQKSIGDTELSMYIWEGYPDFPAAEVLLDDGGTPLHLAYHYDTETYVGISFSSIWDYKVLRLELGALQNNALMMDLRETVTAEEVINFNRKKGLVFADKYLAAIGIETELWSPSSRLIMQYYYEEVSDPEEVVYSKLRQNAVTLSFSQTMGAYERYKLRMDGQYWISDDSYLLRVDFSDQFSQHWRWNLELLHVTGEPDTNFGMYEHTQYTLRLQYEI